MFTRVVESALEEGLLCIVFVGLRTRTVIFHSWNAVCDRTTSVLHKACSQTMNKVSAAASIRGAYMYSPSYAYVVLCTYTVCVCVYIYIYILTPWSRAPLEKLTGSAASQEIPRIFGTRRFLTVSTSARHLSLS